MSEKVVYIQDIGNVKIRKNKRSKRVSIAVRPIKGIVVTLPYFLSYNYAFKLIEQKKQWIEKSLEKVKSIENKRIIFDETTEFKTLHRKLIIDKHISEKLLFKLTSENILIKYPETISIHSNKVQEIIRESIIKALRAEAKEFLPKRTDELAKKLNFSYKKVFIKNNSTLWGSCSGKNNINLNLHLMRLPLYLIDYVIIHELCHTVEKNHGPNFWKLMDSILGNAKKLSKELKSFSINFY